MVNFPLFGAGGVKTGDSVFRCENKFKWAFCPSCVDFKCPWLTSKENGWYYMGLTPWTLSRLSSFKIVLDRILEPIIKRKKLSSIRTEKDVVQVHWWRSQLNQILLKPSKLGILRRKSHSIESKTFSISNFKAIKVAYTHPLTKFYTEAPLVVVSYITTDRRTFREVSLLCLGFREKGEPTQKHLQQDLKNLNVWRRWIFLTATMKMLMITIIN